MSVDESPGLQIDRLLAIVRRGRWLILACALVTALAALCISELETKRYTATLSLLFQNPDTVQGEAGLPQSGTIDPNGVATNVELVAIGPVARSTAQAVGHGLTAQDVRNAISVAQLGQTNIATVRATSTSPTLAAAIANTYAAQFIAARRTQEQNSLRAAITTLQSQIARLSPTALAGAQGQLDENRIASLQALESLQTGDATIAAPATVPTSPSSPKLKRNVLIGLVLGLLLGILATIIVERSSRRVTAGDLEATFALPLLATVGASDGIRRQPLLNGDPPAAANSAGEAFRLLRARLRYFNIGRDVKTVLITSPAVRDGKTTVARDLATTAADMGTKVLLIEADLRHPSLHEALDIKPGPGLVDVLSSSETTQDYQRVVQSLRADGDAPPISEPASNGADTPPPAAATSTRQRRTQAAQAAAHVERQLDVITAGGSPANAAELLESLAMRDLLSWADELYELTIIDTPPPSLYADAIPLITRVDGVIIVCRLGSTTQSETETLRSHLESLGAPVLGIVANAYDGRDSTPRRVPRRPLHEHLLRVGRIWVGR
jgi:Mrp family chromosome partitioning ATPase/capsular polysaccharide biosynthesis protein